MFPPPVGGGEVTTTFYEFVFLKVMVSFWGSADTVEIDSNSHNP